METIIAAGRVSVNSKLLDRRSCRSENDTKIRVDGELVSLIAARKDICRVLMYYKPEGELCTRHDPEGRATVFERLPQISNAR